MKIQLPTLLALALAITIPPAPAAEPANPLADLMVRPDLVLHHADDLKLTAEQRDTLQAAIEEATAQYAEESEKHKKRIAALAKKANDGSVDEEAALALLDRALNSERRMKRIHLALMIKISKTLNADQRAKLTEFKAAYKPVPPEMQKRLQAKMEKVRGEVELLQAAGLPPYDVIDLMQDLQPALQDRDYGKAESVLDKAIALLDLDPVRN